MTTGRGLLKVDADLKFNGRIQRRQMESNRPALCMAA